MAVPFWVQDAVFYQIFPDRFANGNSTNDPPNVQPWGSPPTASGFQGGDLRGIIDKIDYLLDLGVTAIYLNPIFQATSTHRYNTSDYFVVDPKLGDIRDFRALLEAAHNNGLRVILDGVFNHCGRGFFAFNDLLENQESSPYKDWFHVLSFPVDAYSPGEARDYLGWWNLKSLPKFNTNNPLVRKYLLKVGRYWIEQGIDGWRLDVPNEIDDDAFWEEFRYTVRSANPEAYLVGEIWEAGPRWTNDRHFDGLMNYPLRTALLGLLNKSLAPSQFAERVEKLVEMYPRENAYAMLNGLGTHDTERILTLCGGDARKVELANLFIFTYPGAPSIYYGDEIGLEGGKDPDNRRAFPWDSLQWKMGLREFVRRMVSLRRRWACLRRGSFQRVFVDDPRGCYSYARILGDEAALVVLNASASHRSLRIPVAKLGWADGRIVRNQIGPGEYFVGETDVTLPLDPWCGAVLG